MVFLLSLKRLDQKAAFMQLAGHVMTADGVIHENEQHMLGLMRRELDLPDGFQCPALSVEESLAHFDTYEERTSVILELIALALSDGFIHPAEHCVIGRAVEVFGYPRERVASIENWVRRYCELVKEATRFFA